MVRVSVIIPVFNGERYLRETLQSVLAQTINDYEIIVVDDGSVDLTPNIVRDMDSRIRYLYQPNSGTAAAFNAGLRMSTAPYVMFLGADDLCQKQTISELLGFVAARPHLGVAYPWYQFIDEAGKLLPEVARPTWCGNPLRELAVTNTIPALATIIRRSELDSAGGFDERLRSREDWDLLLRLAQLGTHFDYIPEVLGRCRIHTSNKSSRLELGEASQMAVLNKFYDQANLSTDLAALESQARATVYLNSYIGWHQAGDEETAYQKYRQAVITWPDVLVQKETYYRLICADQPPGYRDTEFFKDLAEARHRIEGLLSRLEADESTKALLAARQNAAQAYASWVLAEHHYRVGHRAAALSAIGRAARFEPSHLLSPRFHRSWVRSLLGHSLMQRTRSAFVKR